ncbi:DC1 - like 2 [Theobroma cacao]|nr:DC1 - like 2 [Theobroma cacao]
MEPLQHFSHEHPLIFSEEQSHESEEQAYCSGCGELVSGPSFSCVECGFYLDKKCAEAPSQLNHPFHRNHSLNLLASSPYDASLSIICDFCGEICDRFVYHCSCELDLHIKCALFSYNIAKKRIGEIQQISTMDPLISKENGDEELEGAECFACWKPLLDSVYLSPDCGFYLHAKCLDPCAVNHLPLHEHPLILQFNSERLSCKICQETQRRGFVYCCSICKFALHIECGSPPPIIEDKSHQHPFILFWRRVPFICDACGTEGNYVSYICSTCGIIVHRKCISLPRTLKHPWHFEHPISHTYFLGQDKFKSWECRICHRKDVNSKHGSYSCSICDYIVHVNCAIEQYNWYDFDESGIIDESLEENSALQPYSIIKETKDGENVIVTEIKHFGHEHNLILSNDVKDDKCCDGCVLSIFTSYYYCSQCNFFFHKSCAESPRKKRLWRHSHMKPHQLITSNGIRICDYCRNKTSGFAYTCVECNECCCLRCALISFSLKHQGHEHPLSIQKYQGLCNACGRSFKFAYTYRCKSCNFSLHLKCMDLSHKARHKSDVHHFILTYRDDNDYSESHYCDICEEERNPNHWFYYCAICDTSAHPHCIIGEYPFIKLGSIYTKEDHPHPLTFVQMVYYYPECHACGELCLDLALECKTIGCNYIVHWRCEEFSLCSSDEADETNE